MRVRIQRYQQIKLSVQYNMIYTESRRYSFFTDVLYLCRSRCRTWSPGRRGARRSLRTRRYNPSWWGLSCSSAVTSAQTPAGEECCK